MAHAADQSDAGEGLMKFTEQIIRARAKDIINRTEDLSITPKEAVGMLDHPEGFVRLSAAIWIELHCLTCGHAIMQGKCSWDNCESNKS